MIRPALDDPSKKKPPAIEREYEIEEQSEEFAIPALSTPCFSTPSPPPQPQMKVEESPLLSFSNEELECLKEAMKMLKNHGIAI